MVFSELAIRLAAAALCGAVIGFEREQQQKPAGLRTHMLVSIGSAAFTMAALSLEEGGHGKADGPTLTIDPSRVIQGVAGGIGFLGAGAIMRSSEATAVRGLTTAATIWVVGAVGICCGIGNYKLAAMTAVLVVTIASAIGIIEGWWFAHKPHPISKQVGEPIDSAVRDLKDETLEDSPDRPPGR